MGMAIQEWTDRRGCGREWMDVQGHYYLRVERQGVIVLWKKKEGGRLYSRVDREGAVMLESGQEGVDLNKREV